MQGISAHELLEQIAEYGSITISSISSYLRVFFYNIKRKDGMEMAKKIWKSRYVATRPPFRSSGKTFLFDVFFHLRILIASFDP